MKIVLSVLSAALLAFSALSGYFFTEVRRLSEGLESAQKNLTEARTALQKKEQELAIIAEESKKKTEVVSKAKAERDRLTPTQFGYYGHQIAEGSVLMRLQRLQTTKQELPLDQPSYTDPPQLTFKPGPIRLILYDRMFSMAAPPTMFINIVAKVKDQEAWVIRDRGYNVQVTPRPDNRDMVEIIRSLPPGRYSIKTPNGNYAFSIEGAVNDPDHCVEYKRSTFVNGYQVCPGGTP